MCGSVILHRKISQGQQVRDREKVTCHYWWIDLKSYVSAQFSVKKPNNNIKKTKQNKKTLH